MKHRILAALLAVILFVSCIPAAFAAFYTPEQQLDLLAERFRSISLDAVYSSPLQRARKTAQAVNRHHGLPM